MKKRTYKLECNLYVIVSSKREDLDKLKTATGKKANKKKYIHYEGKTYKKVFKDFHVTVRTNMAKNGGNFKERYDNKFTEVNPFSRDPNYNKKINDSSNLINILKQDKQFDEKFRL